MARTVAAPGRERSDAFGNHHAGKRGDPEDKPPFVSAVLATQRAPGCQLPGL